MEFHSVEMLTEPSSDSNYYSLAIFASGFEARSIFFAKQFDRATASNILVLKFDDNLDLLSRLDNDRFYDSWAPECSLTLRGSDDERLFERLQHIAGRSQMPILRILVDYSVMTRAWYGAILTWSRFAHCRVEIDFIYVSGQYLSEFGPLQMTELMSLPGFEGSSGGLRRTTAIFGLGYDKYAALAVYDRLEPDTTYCCVAERVPGDDTSLKARSVNKELIENSVKTITLPLIDVSSAFRVLAEQILAMERTAHIVAIPMGPKTHVLATLLVSLRLPWITCLHARGTRTSPVEVTADGKMSVARVTFLGNQCAS